MRKKLLSLLALLCLTVSGAWAATGTPEDPWTCGDCTVTLSNGVLTVSGTGAMADYSKSGSTSSMLTRRGWHKDRKSITSVVIGPGVTHIGSYAFYECTNLEKVLIGRGVTSIGDYAFYECPNVNSVYFYGSPDCELGNQVFDSYSIKTYVFADKFNDFLGKTEWSYHYNLTDNIPHPTGNPDGKGYYWATYYNSLADAKVLSNDASNVHPHVFKISLEGTELTLTEITDGIINMGEAVVVMSNVPTIYIVSAASASAASYEGNSLKGTMTSITNPGNAYVLNKTDENGVGFYKLSSGGTIEAGKAYLTYSGDLARGFFGFDEATGIESIDHSPLTIDHSVYDLQGRRVAQPTKGLYIVNGKKVIINK